MCMSWIDPRTASRLAFCEGLARQRTIRARDRVLALGRVELRAGFLTAGGSWTGVTEFHTRRGEGDGEGHCQA
jgi:hypothetical protein